MKIKDILILVFLGLIVIWGYNYEKETIKIQKQFDVELAEMQKDIHNIKTNVEYNDYRITYEIPDYLVVPEKPINYWTDEEIKEFRKSLKNQTQTKVKVNIIENVNIETVTNYIKEKEGFHSKPYRDGCLIKAKVCPKNKYRYSNGYGTLAKSKNEVITKIEAEKRLISHIKTTIYPKLKGVKFKSTQQLHASIDFAYNVGHNAFANNIVTESKEVDCVKMTEYINFNGKENNGLKKRRFENFIQCVSMEI